MILKPIELREFITDDGRSPFRDWLGELQVSVRSRIQARLVRARIGNLGDWKSVGHGIFELKVVFGPGYRIYFAFEGTKVIILLGGGVKGSQRRDILRAREYWIEFQRRSQNDT